MAKYLLIDGNSLTYRAFFALPPDMATSSGQVTNAVFGFVSMLTNVLKDQQPDGVLVAFDRPEPTFRHEAEPEYKAQRESSPDELKQQMVIVREVLTALGVHHVELVGWEADDILATAATELAARGDDAIVVTGDRDSYQLVSDPHIRVMYNKRGVSDYALYDEAGILERTGVTPALYVEYAALRGDPSDNLPGVPGVGEKTAAKLINSYGGVEGILAAIDEQTPKLRANLAESADRVRRNLDLMELRRDAPIGDLEPETLRISPDRAEVDRLFDVLEFAQLRTRILGTISAGQADDGAAEQATDSGESVIRPTVSTVVSPADAVGLVNAAKILDIAATWSGDAGRSALEGIAIVTGELDEAVWVPVDVLASADVLHALSRHDNVRSYQSKELIRSLLELGGDLPGLTFDVGVAAYLIDPGYSKLTIADLLGRFSQCVLDDSLLPQTPSGQLALDGARRDGEAAGIALAVRELAGPLTQGVADSGVASLFRDTEVPLIRVLARMEHIGIAVDRSALEEIGRGLRERVEALATELRAVAESPDLNLNSPTQLRALLYDQHGLSPAGVRKTKSGYSTDAATLEKLRDQWPEFIEPLLRHRELDKLRGTYGEGLLNEVAADDRIHASFNQTVARTGRLSSDRPNLHNIPVRSDEGRVFRTAFVPADGCELLVADYNQIELRCIAHLAADPGLLEAFNDGVDIHNATAARVFGVESSEVSLDQRSKAKMVSYGLAYGMEAYGLGQRLGIPTDEAAVILNSYFEAFPAVQDYMDRAVAEARTKGYTETLFGRRRSIPELLDSNWRVRQAGERQAMNAAIQGLAADVFKIALVNVDQALSNGNFASRIVLQVHDEIIVEVPESEHDEVGDMVVGLMRSAVELDVPLEVNVAWGSTWADAKG
ncbi:MAG: DNA polymerase I [Ilumatobacteraceae bacterium]|nr:DNA polymerase I [Ilumatobacteraceae bacterium]